MRSFQISSEFVDSEEKPYVPFVLYSTLDSVWMSQFFDNDRSFWRNARLLAFVLRFIQNTLSPENRRSGAYPSRLEMTVALQTWARFVQERHFESELKTLTKGDPVLTGPLAKLQPKLHETTGLILVGGRLDFSGLPDEMKHPIILPRGDEFVARYVMALHKVWSHPGPETTLSLVRTRFWLLRGRREIKGILRSCPCYKLRAVAFKQQIAPLPGRRTVPSYAFSHVGLDFAGPCEVLLEKHGPLDEERFAKVWIMLITCMTSRAVHLEYVTRMTTDHFINALHRCIARRRHFTVVHCDNSKTFHKASQELQKLYRALDWDRIQRQLIQVPEPIDFRFIPPLASWAGGVYERMVGSVKKAIRATLGRQRATLEEFRTVLVQAESLVNSRPLSLVTDHPDDALPITPAHLMIGRIGRAHV
jgi:hypothetical protein